ncbi:MAG: restriction endonuclease [Burkholderiaceae bacterium]
MAENSLFAMLMRAPWWASLGIASALVALSFAILPTDYVVFGLAAAVPFIVIAVLVLWKLAKQPRAAVVEAIDQRVRGLNAKAFGAELTQGFESTGHIVQAVKSDSVDLVVTKGWRVTVVSFRKWKAAHVGADPLKALFEARDQHEANGAMAVVLGDLSAPAAKFAEANNIQILRAEDLALILPR